MQYKLGKNVLLENRMVDSAFQKFADLEFGSISKCYSDQAPSRARITLIPLTGDLQLAGSIYSLGKGFFFDEDNDLLLISKNRNSAEYNKKDIFAAIRGLSTAAHRQCFVEVNAAQSRRESAEHIYRKIVEGDPRTRARVFSEKFISQYVEPLIYEAFRSSEQLLLHSAGLERDGSGILILGPQNVGKTTATLALARRGWNMLGDDFVCLNSDLTLSGYSKPLKIERELIRSSRETADKVRSAAVADSALVRRSISALRRTPFEAKVPAAELGIRVARSADTKSIFFLRRATIDGGFTSYQELQPSQCANLLIQHQESEFRGNKHLYRDARNHLALHYGTLWPEADGLHAERDLCEALARSCPSFLVTVRPGSHEHVNEIETLSQED